MATTENGKVHVVEQMDAPDAKADELMVAPLITPKVAEEMENMVGALRKVLLAVPGVAPDTVTNLLDISDRPAFKLPAEIDTKSKIWRMLMKADGRREQRAMLACVISWWTQNPMLTLRTLEVALRAVQCMSCLVAIGAKGNATSPAGTSRPYGLCLITEGMQYAIAQMAHENIDYDENLRRLEQCGILNLPPNTSKQYVEEGVKEIAHLGTLGECIQCGQHVGKKILECGGCRMIRYCGRACQKKHWPLHRPHCRSPLTEKRNPDNELNTEALDA